MDLFLEHDVILIILHDIRHLHASGYSFNTHFTHFPLNNDKEKMQNENLLGAIYIKIKLCFMFMLFYASLSGLYFGYLDVTQTSNF